MKASVNSKISKMKNLSSLKFALVTLNIIHQTASRNKWRVDGAFMPAFEREEEGYLTT